MSDSSTTGIDPRFDARFQRGYTDAAADTGATSPASTPLRMPAVTPTPAPPTYDATARLLEAMERTAPARSIQPPAGAADDGAPERGDAATSVEALEAEAPQPLPGPRGRHERPWFIAGWVLSAALMVAGVWWVWAVNSDPNSYMGSAPADMAFRQLGWSLAPTFMQAGALGLALVTTFAAARQLDRTDAERRRAGADPAAAVRGFWRMPGIVALIVIAAASALIVIWLVGRVVDGSVYGFGPEPTDEQIIRVALAQVGTALVGPLVLASVGSVLGVILLGARDARRVGDVPDVSARPER